MLQYWSKDITGYILVAHYRRMAGQSYSSCALK